MTAIIYDFYAEKEAFLAQKKEEEEQRIAEEFCRNVEKIKYWLQELSEEENDE